MNKLLLNYIKYYIKESAIPYSSKEIGAELQHELSPKMSKDMTSLSDEDVLKIIMQNIDERTCISFVNKYDESIPSFNINPHARYRTPHGNYAYPLTLESLREIITTKKVKGAEFAIDRPYFLLFKVNSPNAVIINKDGTTNYKSLRSARRAMSRGKTITLDQDINTIIRTFMYFVRTLSKENPSLPEWNSLDNDIFNRQLPHFYSLAEDEFESFLNKDINIEPFVSKLGTILRKVVHDYLSLRSKIPSLVEKKFFNDFSSLFKEYLVELSESEVNKFYKGDDTDEFHKIYFICWLLSQVGEVSNQKKSNGPILTLLLRSVGLDAIIDQGSSTIHQSEPEQTVSLSFGNIEAKDIEFLGTFKNIFKKSDEYIEELAAKIYEEEGFKYNIDFFSKNKNPMSSLAGSTVYTYLEDLLLSYSMNDTIKNRGLIIDGGNLKVRFDLYADEIESDISDIAFLIELISEAILKSPHKHKIKIDLGITLFNNKSIVDLTDVLNKLYSVSFFNNFMNMFSEGFLTLKNIGDNCFLNCNRYLMFNEFYILIDETCSFMLNFKERFFLNTIIKNNNFIKIDMSAPVTFNLLDIGFFRTKRMEKIPDKKKEVLKKSIIQKISEKYPEAKVEI